MKSLFLFIALFLVINSNAQSLNDVRALDELNVSNQADAYPYITDDGLQLYYTNNESGTNNLYVTSRTDLASDFGPKQLVDSSLFIGLTSCWLSADELNAYYSTYDGIFRATRPTVNASFSSNVQLTLAGGFNTFYGGASLTQGGEELYFYNGSNLVKYEYTNDTTYTFVSNVTGAPVGYDPLVGQLSQDGLELYWSVSPVGQDSVVIYKLDRLNISDDFANPVRLNSNINSTDLFNTQASFAGTANVLVWVRNTENTWAGNDLYIAQSGPSGITELDNSKKELVKIVDFMGRETVFRSNTPLIYIFSDGSTERIFTLE